MHTKGPWEIRNESTICGPKGNIIADCFGYSDKAQDPWQQAQGGRESNARLIAAAPDLLEALERLTIVANLISQRLHLLGRDMGYAGQYDGYYPCSAHHVELDMATHAAEQLLAKAKGA